MAHMNFKIELFYILLFFIQYSYADHKDDCKLMDLEENVRKIDSVIVGLKFNEGEDDQKQKIIETNEKIKDILKMFYNLPEDCQNIAVTSNEFARDVKLIRQCNEAPLSKETIHLFEGYNSNNTNYFKEMLSCANEITSSEKRAELFRALARISFLSDFETNQEFYNQLKELIADADSAVSNILMEAMKILVAKTVKIPDDYCKVRPELWLDLYQYNKLAAKQAIEMMSIDVLGQYSSDSFIMVNQIPEVSLRAYAYLAMWNADTKPDIVKEANSIVIIPHLEYIMNSEEFENLDEDLKNKIKRAYEDAPSELKTLLNEGEICLAYVNEELPITERKPNRIYLKADGSNTIDWKFIEHTEGNIKTKPISHFQLRRIFLPVNLRTPTFWSGNMTNGNWEMAPDGTDCDFNEETYDIYVCRNVGEHMRSPEYTRRYLKGDQVKIDDINSRRKAICGV